MTTKKPAGVETGLQGDPEPMASFAPCAKSGYVMVLSEDAPIWVGAKLLKVNIFLAHLDF